MKITSSIKNKVSALIGIIFFLFILNNLWAVINLRKLNDSINAIMKSNFNSIAAVENMSLTLERQDSLQLSYIFTKDKNFVEEFYKNKKIFYKNLKIEQNNITERGEKELAKAAADNYEVYIKNFENFLKTADETERETLYFNEIFPVFEKLKKTFRELIDLNQTSMLEKKEKAAETSKKAVVSIILLVSTTTIIGGILSSFIINGIFVQFRELIEKMNKISKGDYSQRIKPLNDKELRRLAETFNTMSEELSSYKITNIRKLTTEKKKAEAVVENISDGIIVTDLEGKIILINKMAKYLFNLSKTDEDILGKDFTSIIDNEEIFKKLKKNIENKESEEDRYFEETLHTDKEIYTKIFINKISIKNESIGAVILIQDITKLKKIDQIKTEFISTVSHEFKTPLTSTKMAVNMLDESKNLDENQKEYINIIKEDNERLNVLINDLLDLSKIESGNIIMNMQKISVLDIINNALNPLKKLFESENVYYKIENFDESYKVIADFNKITWVMTNFLTNAVKYKDSSKESKVFINAVKHKDKIIFSVKDNGIGIEKEFHEKIFNKFIRVNVSEDGKVTGTGLGLSICKSIIDAHKGKIWVESQKGIGSTFYFELKAV